MSFLGSDGIISEFCKERISLGFSSVFMVYTALFVAV